MFEWLCNLIKKIIPKSRYLTRDDAIKIRDRNKKQFKSDANRLRRQIDHEIAIQLAYDRYDKSIPIIYHIDDSISIECVRSVISSLTKDGFIASWKYCCDPILHHSNRIIVIDIEFD